MKFYDEDLLLSLDQDNNKIKYARITSLSSENNMPLESIEGKVTQGSINIDGTSAVRHSCSLTIMAQEFNYSTYLWSFKTRFRLEIGLWSTKINDIVWFDQGIFIVSSFNTSRSTNNFTISISGKDKMCLLNGEMGGTLNASTDFGTIEEETEEGVWSIKKIPIKQIIQNVVHYYGNEPLYNIIIEDLDSYGLELLEYRGEKPLYLYYNYDDEDKKIINIFLEDNDLTFFYLNEEQDRIQISLSEINDNTDYNFFTSLVDTLHGNLQNVTPVYFSPSDKNRYGLIKIEYGEAVGYRTTDLVYAGDLITNIGESLTSVLDKIKNMLVEFEYFYNNDGQFVFRKKPSFINTLWNFSVDTTEETVPYQYMTNYSQLYYLPNFKLTTSFNTTPNIQNIKNDYSIWGERTTASGQKVPIHLRYAIDQKPTKYTTIKVEKSIIDEYNKKYNTKLEYEYDLDSKKWVWKHKDNFTPNITYSVSEKCDWREVIYQMALDYFRFNWLDDFEYRVGLANSHFPMGRTGYEHYYTDLQGFWRQLYNPTVEDGMKKVKEQKESKNEILSTKKEDLDKIKSYQEQLSFLIETETIKNYKNYLDEAYNNLTAEITQLELEIIDLENTYEDYQQFNTITYWHSNVTKQPQQLNFWFDFLDTDSEIGLYSIKNIGQKIKTINENSIQALYYKETPEIIFINSDEEKRNDISLEAFSFITIPNYEQLFTISGQGKSAKDRLDELLTTHTCEAENVSITTIPMYYLEPNMRVTLQDEKTGLSGEYNISKLTIPLVYNGTMSITASKAYDAIT